MPEHGERGQVPTPHLRSMIRLLYPDEMTPVAKRHLEAMCDQWDEAHQSGGGDER